MMKRLLLILAVIFSAGYTHAQTCIGSATITPNPPPFDSQGHYLNGTVVTFCVTINDYAQTGVDWLCGVVPQLGPGWDLSTLAPVSAAASCDGLGTWAWYTSCTSTNSGQTFGPGFYYDTPSGSPGGTADGIPGNNYGDNCQTNVWTFCFQCTVDINAPPLTDLSVSVAALPDNVCGSWGTAGCFDPPIDAPQPYSVLTCTLTVPTLNTTDVTCFGDGSGTASVTPASGYTPYSYLWSNGATTAAVTGLNGGIYSVTVTDSIGCQKIVYAQIGSPPMIELNATQVNIGCISGSTTGSISTNVTGGTGTFTYLWSNGETTASISGLSSGTYDVTVTDALGCTESDGFAINVVPALIIGPNTITPETCGNANGVATINVTSGSAPYTYTWPAPIIELSNSADSLVAGTYYVGVSDANGCNTVDTVVVTSLATFTATPTSFTANCAGTGGSASISTSGNNGPFTFQWTPNVSSDSVANNINAGTYNVVITDASNCSQTLSIIVGQLSSSVAISNPVITQAAPCDANSLATIVVSASNGLAPYNYIWSSGSLDSVATGLSAGTYTVTVTDVNQCTASTFVTVDPITPVATTLSPVDASCAGNDGSVSISITTGGTAPYTYLWSNGVTTTSATGLIPGNYSVVVSDANNCSATASISIVLNTSATPVISSVSSSAATICAGESTNLNVSATNAVTYNWSPSTGLDNSTISNPLATPSATTTYTVTVYNGVCSSDTTIDVNVLPVVDAVSSPSSDQGTIPFTVNFSNAGSGGTSPIWYFGDGTTGSGNTISHVYNSAGTYDGYLVISNALGCTDTAYFKINVDDISTLDVFNVFTPNNDGKNDTWKFNEYGIATIKVELFNRWGNKVYGWTKLNGEWNGKTSSGNDAPDGTYFYTIIAKGNDGKDYDLKGTVTLVRINNKN